MLTPLFDSILFVFLDDFKRGFFREETDWGFKIGATTDNSTQAARWAKVLSVGPDVPEDDVKKGTYILVEPLMWTKGVKNDGLDVWKTDISKVMLVSEEIPS